MRPAPTLTPELAARGARRDPDAMAQIDALFARHRPGVVSLCRRMVGNPDRAEELAQETLALAWEKLPEFRGESSFSGWLAGIARNLCLNAIRKRTDVLTEDGVLEPGDPDAGVLASMHRAERDEVLRLASQALTPLEQEVVHLRYVDEAPVDAITRILGLPGESGARGVLQRCRRKLEASIREVLAARGLGSSFIRSEP